MHSVTEVEICASDPPRPIRLSHADPTQGTFNVPYTVSEAVGLARLLLTAAYMVDPATVERLVTE